MFRSSSEKNGGKFHHNVSTRVSINKKGADLIIKGIFKPEQSVQFTLRLKNYFQIAKMYGFIDTIY